ncbi:MAG: hypothetical protein ACREJ2_09060 [Planctomycetota bacterium]
MRRLSGWWPGAIFSTRKPQGKSVRANEQKTERLTGFEKPRKGLNHSLVVARPSHDSLPLLIIVNITVNYSVFSLVSLPRFYKIRIE